MDNFVRQSLKNGLKGAFSHANPSKEIEDLDIELDLARKRVEENSHSIWELLFHMVFWQDIFIENIKGNNPRWDDEASWPTKKDMKKDENFEELKERYVFGVEEINQLIESTDLEENLKYCRNEPRIQLVIVAITHNSYHTGQIMMLKNILKSQT